MPWEQKPNSGSLWKNDERTEETHAHAKGSALIGGIEYWVNAWTKETKDGQRYQSLSFRPKEAAKPQRPVRPATAAHGGFEDIPF